jgi:FkbM family methyltransferase
VSDGPDNLQITWAQHWEDVRLWRVLRDREPGFYVDVGAMDPEEDSVTKVFYDLGWRGIDVEPDPEFAEALRRARPNDLVAEVAASDGSGMVSLHRVSMPNGERSGLSTMNQVVADRHEADGLTISPIEVTRAPLEELMSGTDAEHPDRFHFLKVDVESHEAEVLAGAALDRIRPLVVLIEAREPNETTDAYEAAEEILTRTGYPFAVDDGLNRWYVRQEDEQVAALLRPHINPVLDGAPRRGWEVEQERGLHEWIDSLETQNRAAETRNRVTEELLAATRIELERSQAEALRLEDDVRAIRGSRSWRVTAPLRSLSRFLGRAG